MRFTGDFLGRVGGKDVEGFPQDTRQVTDVWRGVHTGTLDAGHSARHRGGGMSVD